MPTLTSKIMSPHVLLSTLFRLLAAFPPSMIGAEAAPLVLNMLIHRVGSLSLEPHRLSPKLG
jgi:hypothetical protein